MKLRRGCGCPILLLLVFNLIFAVAALVGLVRGMPDQPVQARPALLVVVLVAMLCNVVVCTLLAMAALRGQPVGEKAEETAVEEYEEEAQVSEEEDKES